ncbi:MAG: MerR family transcriptional regulator [Chitinophagaceae bacterium]|nr:MerR family transcriptional regulator [Chitinophagaceae bacterium]
MNFYQISELQRLSGIKAHTIRIWEKRYAIIAPHRTDTNIRYYDDVQLKKLLNVAVLVAAGYKISKIAALSPAELREAVSKMQEEKPLDKQTGFYISQLVSAMLQFDEGTFSPLFDEILRKYGVEKGVLEVIYPFLHKTGLLWSVDETLPVQEHFASTLIRRKFLARIDALSEQAAEKQKKFIVFLPHHEWHELGTLFGELLIRSRGHRVINLGPSVPFEELEYTIGLVQPDYLFTLLTSDSYTEPLASLSAMLSARYKKTSLLLAGHENRLAPFAESRNLKLLRYPKDILMFL